MERHSGALGSKWNLHKATQFIQSSGFDIISRKKSIIVFTLYHYSIRRWQEAIVSRGIAPPLVDSIHTGARQHLLLEYLIDKATP